MKSASGIPENSSTSSLKSYFLDVRPSIVQFPNHLSSTSKTVAQKLFDDKERSHRIFKDEVYSLKDWSEAKSWHRHLPSLNSIEILRGYSWIVVWCFLVAMLVCSYHYWLEPLGAPGWADNDADVWQVFNLTSFALALLLVFRTNSSYGRWWEARILWGSQINMTRDIVRRAISWFPKEEEALLLMFARWSITMSFALKTSLRGENAVPELQRILPEKELEWASKSNHLPTTTAQILSDILAMIDIPHFHRITIDQDINRYVDILGSCERILKTPIHRNWTSHTSRFTLVWLTFFPFALWPVYGWHSMSPTPYSFQCIRLRAAPGIQVVVAWLLLGIENIGVQIEEPFAVLALDAYCNVCERSVQDLMSQRRGASRLVTMTRGSHLVGRQNSLGGHCGTRSDSDGSGGSEPLRSGEAQGRGSHMPRGSIEI